MNPYWKFLSIFCSCLGALIFWYSSKCQIGLTYDSYDYLASAISFAKEGTLLTQHGTLHTMRTPLFSIILSFWETNILFWVKILHLICLFISLYIFLNFGFRLISQSFLKIIYALGLTFGTALYLIHHFLWSEALFLSMLGGTTFLYIHIQNNLALEKLKKFEIFSFIILGILLTLQRNTGVIFILGFVGLLLFHAPHMWKGILGVSFIILLPWLIWVIGTLWLNPQETHPIFSDFETGFWQRQNLLVYADAISRWFLPSVIPITIRGIFIIILMIGLTFFLGKNFKSDKRSFDIWFVILFYLLVMQLTEKVALEEVQRYAAVIFPLLILLIFLVLDKLIPLHTVIRLTFVFLLVGWVIYSGLRTYKNIQLWSERSCQEQVISLNLNNSCKKYFIYIQSQNNINFINRYFL